MFVMRERRPRPVLAVAVTASVLVAGLLAGCGGGATTGASVPSTVSPSAVVVRSDVTYAAPVPADWLPAALDVYASPGAKDSPLVVFLHGGGVTKTDLQYREIGKTLAARGAVVLVPNWGPTVFPGSRKDAGWAASAIVEEQRSVADEVACAVAFAVAHAAEYGADPAHLVLVGHSAGASLAGEVALTPTRAFPGCAAAPVPATPRGIMLWDGDWLMTDTGLDVIGADLGALVPAYSPWPSLGGAHTTATVELAITPNSRTELTREATTSSDWLTTRDPTGAMTKDLAKLKAFDDGSIDIVDVTDGFSASLADHGIDNTILQLADSATGHTYLAPADFALMVNHILKLGT